MDNVEETIIKPLADTSQADLVAPVESVGKAGTNYAPDPMLRKREMLLLDQMTGAQKEQQDLTAQHNARMAPEYERAQGMIDQPRPALPPLQQPPEAPDTREQDHKAMSDYFFPMLAFAAVLSKVGGADMATGLNMLSQGVIGMKMGRDEVAKQSIEKWRNSMESVKEKNAALIAQYKAVAEDRSLSMQEQQMRMSLIAAQHGDAIMSTQLKEKGALGALKALNEMEKRDQTFERLNQQMDAKVMEMEKRSEIKRIERESIEKVEQMKATARKEVEELKVQAAANRIAAKKETDPVKRWEHYRKDLEALKKWRANAMLGIDKALMSTEGKQQAAAYIDQEFQTEMIDLAQTYESLEPDDKMGTVAPAPKMGKTEGGFVWPWSSSTEPKPPGDGFSIKPIK